MINRDKEAEKLLEMMEKMLFKFCNRTKTHFMIDDLKSLGHLIIVKTLNNYNPSVSKAKITSYFFKAFMRALIQYSDIYYKKYYSSLSLDYEFEDSKEDFKDIIPDPSQDFEDGLVKKLDYDNDKKLVEKLLSLKILHENEKKILNMYFRENIGDAEIAERMGFTHGSIRTIKYNAIKKLRKHMEVIGHERFG